MGYSPNPTVLIPGLQNASPEIRALADYITNELREISKAFSEGDVLESRTVYKEPQRPREGMIAVADGTHWDPGDGPGPYVYTGGNWVFMANQGLPDGDYGDITVSAGGTVFTIDNNAITNAKLADDSVDSAEIKANAVGTSEIANDAVTYAKIQDAAANTIIARAANTSGDLSEVAINASQLAGRGSTGDIAAIAVDSATMQMSGTTLKGKAQIYLGTANVNGTTNTNLIALPTFTSYFLRIITFSSSLNNNLRVLISEDNGSSFGANRVIHTGDSAIFCSFGNAIITGVGATATNKVVTPNIASFGDLDSAGSSSSYTTTATENVKTGITNALRFNHSAASARSIIEVYGIP